MLSNSIALIALAAMFGIEAYKASERLPRFILTAIAAFFGLAGMLIQPLAEIAPKVVALVTATFSEPSSWFILLIALFFVFRPFWNRSTPNPGRPLSNSAIPEIDHMERDRLRGEIEALKERIEAAAGAADGVTDYVNGANAAQDRIMGEVRDDLQDMRQGIVRNIDEQHDFQEKMEAWVGGIRDDMERRLENIDLAFAALSNREWHQRLFRELGDEFERLARPIDEGNGIADWEAWKKAANSWTGKLDQWLIIADYYAVGTADVVRAKPEHLYYGDWQFNEAPLKADQVHRFKEIAIWWHNAKAAKARVNRCLQQTIFTAPSKKGRLDSPPRIEDSDDG